MAKPTKAQLKKAEELEIEVSEDTTKEQLTELIEAADVDSEDESGEQAAPKDAAVFLSKSKHERAKAVVLGTKKFKKEGHVEVAALEAAKAEGVKGDAALIEAVYRKLGGAIAGEASAVDTRTGVIDSKTEGKEVESLPSPD